MNECLFPGCGLGASVRGLCTSHYRSAFQLVKSGKVTWEQLEAAGKCRVVHRKNKYGDVRGWLLEGVK